MPNELTTTELTIGSLAQDATALVQTAWHARDRLKEIVEAVSDEKWRIMDSEALGNLLNAVEDIDDFASILISSLEEPTE